MYVRQICVLNCFSVICKISIKIGYQICFNQNFKFAEMVIDCFNKVRELVNYKLENRKFFIQLQDINFNVLITGSGLQSTMRSDRIIN